MKILTAMIAIMSLSFATVSFAYHDENSTENKAHLQHHHIYHHHHHHAAAAHHHHNGKQEVMGYNQQ